MRSIPLAIVFSAFAALAAAPDDARAQVVVVSVRPPPPAYIATVRPVYYEGRPVYFYNGYWHYRNGNRWMYYRSEPGYLRPHRERYVERYRYRYRR
jgi:hypothetical protein